MSRIFIMDPGLRKRSGHNYQMAVGVAAGARAAGLQPIVLGLRDADLEIREELGLRPIFTQSHYVLLSSDPYSGLLEDFQVSSRRIARELGQLRDIEIRDEDLVFLPTASPREMSGLAMFLRERRARPKVVALFHRTEPPGTSLQPGSVTSAMLRLACKQLANAVSPARLLVAATTEILAEKLSEPAGRKVVKFPAPVWYPAPCAARPAGAGNVKSAPVITFLGHMKFNHGFDTIPGLARELRTRWPDARIRIHLGVVGPNLNLSEYRVIHADGVAEVIEGWLDDSAMAALYCEATVLVMPYDREAYSEMVSAVFSTGVALGKPCVVPQGSWMSARIQAGRAVGGVFLGQSVGDIADVVDQVIDRIEDYTTRAEAVANHWRRDESGEALVEELLNWYKRQR